MFIIGVVNVADCKRNVNRHLNSAQQWLSEAEQAFGKDKDIRGELNLFLAQAELTHAKEATRSRQWRYKYPVLQHGLAFCLAVTVAIVGVGASYWWGVNRHQVQPVPENQQSVSVRETSPIRDNPAPQPVTPTQASVLPAASPVAEQPVATEAQPAVYKQPVAPSYEASASTEPRNSAAATDQSKEVPLTANEINKLVRTAGQSLRGQ